MDCTVHIGKSGCYHNCAVAIPHFRNHKHGIVWQIIFNVQQCSTTISILV